MKKMFNRLYQWMWHVSVRRDNVDLPLKGKAALYRYPSPGNIIQPEVPEDYRTPFSETHYNVRYLKPTNNQRKEEISQTIIASKIDPTRKLILTHLLKESDTNDAAKVAAAKSRFKQLYGYNCESSLERNDLLLPYSNTKDREALRKAYEQASIAMVIQAKDSDMNSEEWVQHPDILEFESLDLYDAPHFQQSRIENAYALDEIIRSRAQAGVEGIETKKGSANYWKALDDSHDPHNIEKVQSKIGDDQPTNFSIQNARVKFEYDRDGNVVNIHRIPSN